MANTNASGTKTLQPQSTPQQSLRASSSTSQSSVQSSAPQVVTGAAQPSALSSKQSYAALIDYTQYCPDAIPYALEYDDRVLCYYITEKVMDLFGDEFGCHEAANWQNLTNLAVALFIGAAGGLATASSGGGGGSSTGNNWGRDKDEDDLRWKRRCAKAATQKLGSNRNTD